MCVYVSEGPAGFLFCPPQRAGPSTAIYICVCVSSRSFRLVVLAPLFSVFSVLFAISSASPGKAPLSLSPFPLSSSPRRVRPSPRDTPNQLDRLGQARPHNRPLPLPLSIPFHLIPPSSIFFTTTLLHTPPPPSAWISSKPSQFLFIRGWICGDRFSSTPTILLHLFGVDLLCACVSIFCENIHLFSRFFLLFFNF